MNCKKYESDFQDKAHSSLICWKINNASIVFTQSSDQNIFFMNLRKTYQQKSKYYLNHNINLQADDILKFMNTVFDSDLSL